MEEQDFAVNISEGYVFGILDSEFANSCSIFAQTWSQTHLVKLIIAIITRQHFFCILHQNKYLTGELTITQTCGETTTSMIFIRSSMEFNST